ncbi:unnamed protein product [Knipowitschia caucasica]
MLPFKRTLEPEKRQLQELNCRLAQYLNRTKQLEQENENLIREIHGLRKAQTRTAQIEPASKVEMRDMRRALENMSLERSQAQMDRERLRRELESVRALCSEHTGVCEDVIGELRGCEQELNVAHRINGELQHRLRQVEGERARLEEAHMGAIQLLRQQVETRTISPYTGPRGSLHLLVTMEDVQDIAFGLSEGWVKTLDMYQLKVDEMEQAIQEDQACMCDLQREKVAYAAQLESMRGHVERQRQEQSRLEQQLVSMQEKFHIECEQYQMVICELQRERELMAQSLEKKMSEHQQLLQLRMDLSLELAAYRALLESERINMEDSRGMKQSKVRMIESKARPQPYSPQTHSSIWNLPDFRPSYKRPSVPNSGALSSPRIRPISMSRNQSSAARRDMITFTNARAAQSSISAKDVPPTVKFETNSAQFNNQSSIIYKEEKSARTSKSNYSKSQMKENAFDSSLTDRSVEPTSKNKLSVEEMIEKAIKPSSEAPGDPKVRYHIEKTVEEDGTLKTRIVLESKIEEELDISKDSDLDEFLHQGTKKMSLEDIKDSSTAGMIKNLLSGMKEGEDMSNKLINVEIIEEPVESMSDNEEIMTQNEEQAYFHIEELENLPLNAGQVSRKSDSSLVSEEYFISTPDNFSGLKEGCEITSYGHYGIVEDLSDERYYRDEILPQGATLEESEEFKFLTGDRSPFKEGFPECIIEEEVRVSPIVQESVLEFLREDSLEPKDQLKGALEKLQESISGPLKEELAYLSKISRESPDKVAVDIRKVERSSEDGTMTIVAELNVSQTLAESGLLEEDTDLSEEQIMAALGRADLEKAFQSGTGGVYNIMVSTEEEHGLGEVDERREVSEEQMAEEVKEQRIVYLESPSNN